MCKTRIFFAPLLLAGAITLFAGSGAAAADAAWRVSKASGDVWVTTTGAQPVALTNDVNLNPGDMIRTGQTGRVLLVRGAETMMISANSAVGIPTQKKSGLSTTIIQQAGSILLDVEKRNVQHFEVETPYLAAVVKGTQFRVTVQNNSSQVEVIRGQVQVTDFRSGQYAIVKPAQVARVSFQGPAGLSLSGSGVFNPVHQGMPRNSAVTPITVPKDGFTAPAILPKGQQVRAAAQMRYAAALDGTDDMGYFWRMFGGEHRTRSEQISVIMAIPLAAGVSVAIGAAAFRRRRKQKDQQKPDDRK